MSTNPDSAQSAEFPFGRRIHITQNVTAQPTYDIQPLQRQDFLHAVEGDEFAHGTEHDALLVRVGKILRHHLRYNPATRVIESAILHVSSGKESNTNWSPMPDLSIVDGLAEPSRRITTLRAGTDWISVRAIFELTSPRFADLDLDEKRAIYQAASVQEYWVVDTGLRTDKSSRKYSIHAWRLEDHDYWPIQPDSHGKYVSDVCRLWLRVQDDRQSIEMGDLRTGKLIQTDGDHPTEDKPAQAEATARAQSIADQLKL